MHERVSVSSLCFMGAPLDDQERYWRELEPKRISFVSLQVFQEGEDKARAIVEKGNYRVETISHPFSMEPLPQNEEEWQPLRESLSRTILFAKSIGAQSIYMVTGGRGRRSWEEAAEIFSAAVAPGAAEAREADIPLLIETAPFVYAGNHIPHSLRDTVTLAEMAGIGVCIDLFSVWSEAGLKQTIERALPISHLVQVGDYVFGDKSLPMRAVPGDGDIPIATIIEWIVKGGYADGFDLELLGPRIDKEGQVNAARRAAQYVGDVLEKLGV
jgi:sugar phosphate isomerase/epimerase